jgi:deoxyribodipyrimidine photo-lyase
MPRTIVWFRRDLRLEDNAALLAATAGDGLVIPVYLIDWERDYEWRPGEAGRWWLFRSLAALAAALDAEGAPLHFTAGEPATALVELCRVLGVDRVVWNRVYEPWVVDLDRTVETALQAVGVETCSYPGALLFEPERLLSGSGRPFVQFTAFWRRCARLPEPTGPAQAPTLSDGLRPGTDQAAAWMPPSPAGSDWAPTVMGPATQWEPGEAGARRRLERFVAEALAGYETARDFPGVEGVSRLSPHLHFGELSPHQVWHAVRQAVTFMSAGGAIAGAAAAGGAGVFLRQLGWREFGHYLLWHFPTMPSEPFRRAFAGFSWLDDPQGRMLWQRGSTGYPLVDAGMRQLQAEGWVHNRVRMVVASFLTKDLLIPWQDGAAWFWDRLVDADLANNTLGWQWTAGSGPDAVPYFRVYNPALQSKRFDARAEYVRRWVPELDPAVGTARTPYPSPLVDHAAARERALAAYRRLQGR